MIYCIRGILWDSEHGQVTKKLLRKWKKDPMLCHKIAECCNMLSHQLDALCESIYDYCYAILKGCSFKTSFKPKALPHIYGETSKPSPKTTYYAVFPAFGETFQTDRGFYGVPTVTTVAEDQSIVEKPDHTNVITHDFRTIGLLMRYPNELYGKAQSQSYIYLFEVLVRICFESWVMLQSIHRDNDSDYDSHFYVLGLESKYWTKKRIKECERQIKTIEEKDAYEARSATRYQVRAGN